MSIAGFESFARFQRQQELADDALKSTQPVIGWRAWIVVPYKRLDGSNTYRLHVAGSGRPAVWEPRRPTVAVCAEYGLHEAPQLNHRCGVWALKDPEVAQQVAAVIPSEGFPSFAWGRVSLWGRVVEHARGYRAQYAYPYAITVHSHDARVASAIRDAYAVDVEWVPSVVARPKMSDGQLAELKRRIAALPALPPADELTAEELLSALFVAIVAERTSLVDDRPYIPAKRGSKVSASEVTSALMLLRGAEGSLGFRHSETGWSTIPQRAGFASRLRRVARALARLAESGSVKGGRPYRHANSRAWRIEAAGREQLAQAGWPRRVTFYRGGEDDPLVFTPVAIETDEAFASLSYPTARFTEEIDDLRPLWRAQRQTARAKGERAHATWFANTRRDAKRRGESEADRIALTDEEVLGALRELGPDPVSGGIVYASVAPGRVTRSEASSIGQALFRMHKAGLVSREKVGGKLVWTATAKVASNA